jgi:hypothetical protein
VLDLYDVWIHTIPFFVLRCIGWRQQFVQHFMALSAAGLIQMQYFDLLYYVRQVSCTKMKHIAHTQLEERIITFLVTFSTA